MREQMAPAIRRRRLISVYGITEEQFVAMLAAQDGRCANPGCRTDKHGHKNWIVDHDHKTMTTRGLLCYACNLALGFVTDDPNKLQGLIDYLKMHQAGIAGASDTAACGTGPHGV